MMCFRTHDPSYSPPLNECPDGTIEADEKVRLQKWGICWNRYYRLDISYYMSSLAQNTLGILKNSALWMNSFSTTPLQAPDKQQRICERVTKVRYIFNACVVSFSFLNPRLLLTETLTSTRTPNFYRLLRDLGPLKALSWAVVVEAVAVVLSWVPSVARRLHLVAIVRTACPSARPRAAPKRLAS